MDSFDPIVKTKQDDWQSSSRYQAARKLVAKGIAVFPCYPGTKRPWHRPGAAKGEDGFKNETTDLAQIDVWWQEADYNLAVRPVILGCVAIDLDLYKPGGVDPAFVASLPPTKTTTTPRGGEHRLYKTDEPWGNSRGGLPRNVDVRCGNGYILLPPSVVEGMEYRVADNRPPALLPDAVRAALRAASAPKEKVAAPDGLVENDDDPVLVAAARDIIAAHIRKPGIDGNPQGIGNDPRGDRAYALANLLGDKRNGENILSVEKIIELMQEQGYGEIADDIIDRRKVGERGHEQITFDPADPEGDMAAKWAPLAGRIARLEVARLLRNPALVADDDPVGYEPETRMDDLLGVEGTFMVPIAAGCEKGKTMLDELIADLGGVAPEQQEKPRNRFTASRRTPEDGAKLPAVEYWDRNKLLPRIPGEGCTVMIVGAKSTHKTGTAMKFCLDAIEEKGARVLYLALEGGRGVEVHRLPAYREARGMPWAALNNRWNTVTVPFRICDEKHHKDLIEAYRDLMPNIIVIDVLAKTAPGLNMSATEVGSKIMTMADDLAAAFGATVLILNHPKRDGDTSIGSVFFGDLAYAELQCAREGDLVKVYVEKMKDGEADRAVRFKIDSSREDRVPVITEATVSDLAEARRKRGTDPGPDPIVADVIAVLVPGRPPIGMLELTKRLSDQFDARYGQLRHSDLSKLVRNAVWGGDKNKRGDAIAGPLAGYVSVFGEGTQKVYQFAATAAHLH